MSFGIELLVADLEAAIRFYEDVLGFTLERHDDGYGSLHRGGAVLGLGPIAKLPPEGPGPGFTQRRLSGVRGAGVEIMLEVGDLDAALERVEQAGHPIAEPAQLRPWACATSGSPTPTATTCASPRQDEPIRHAPADRRETSPVSSASQTDETPPWPVASLVVDDSVSSRPCQCARGKRLGDLPIGRRSRSRRRPAGSDARVRMDQLGAATPDVFDARLPDGRLIVSPGRPWTMVATVVGRYGLSMGSYREVASAPASRFVVRGTDSREAMTRQVWGARVLQAGDALPDCERNEHWTFTLLPGEPLTEGAAESVLKGRVRFRLGRPDRGIGSARVAPGVPLGSSG